MNSTLAHRAFRAASVGLLVLVTFAARAAESPVPRPPGLERDVQFWVRVYTEVNTNAGFIHDDRNLGVIYETLKFGPNTPPRERENAVQQARDRYTAALRRIAASSGGELSPEDQRLKDMWGAEGNPPRLLEATNSIRFQLGQADRFLEGLVRAGAWQAHIAEVFANEGLPHELAVLPHVESSFNPAAYSKVGAAGLWQFMRSTGRRYMRIDNSVDDRMDPFRSTEAAAQLLAYNYRLLGTWPLALTAYNHGAAGMRRAKDALGTDDIERIVRSYKSPSFGFASRNFYVSFLAALEIDSNPDKYFGNFKPQPEIRFREVTLPSFVPIASLRRTLGIDDNTLRVLNPALRPPVWNGQRHVPKGYRLRVPAEGDKWTPELIAARLAPSDQFANQPEERRHRVRSGETLAAVAARYGVSAEALAQLNGLSSSAKLRAGRSLVVPAGQALTVAAAAAAGPPTPPAAVEAPATEVEGANVYIVRRGDSIEQISKKMGLTEADLLKINQLKNRNYIYEGQKLLIAAVTQPAVPPQPAPPVAATPTRPAKPVPVAPAAASKPIVVASNTAGGVPAAEAQRESEEDAEAVSKVGKPATRAEPVSAAQAAEIGPALGPAVETPQTADPIDYSVGKDDTIFVVAEETLGHYADWLGITANRLRQVNNMKYGRPVLIGRKLKLDFAKVDQERFEQTRREYHRSLQASYFAAHRILGTEVYIVRRGDSLWTVTQRFERLPMWLLQQYNPDVDFSEMRAGTEIVVPKVEEFAASG
ncbi:MAG TPA: LysM peptidoglycan-binding domain-containing protein [Steroidobacteraceae bacterium]|jgi:membrane-bound lytic murein transglycosylase D|nr:LysM peptidoglycan-binding domain-containing protein [Steroidobacteraceae bacterium]